VPYSPSMVIQLKSLLLIAGASLIVAGAYVYSLSLNKTSVSWHMINVNSGKLQGDANLIIVGNKTVMIDAGYVTEAKKDVLPYLKKIGVKQIDHFFVSHPHRDHYEGFAAILSAGIPIKNLYYKMPAEEIKDCCYNKKHFLKFINFARDHGARLIQPAKGFSLSLSENSSIEILHAQEGNPPNAKIDVNDLSLIMKWRINGKNVLFTGDLNRVIGKILSTDPRMKSDFLKMPHHGGSRLAPNSFFNMVNPVAVLVPAPEWLWCSRRGDQARMWSESRKIPTWVNGINGNIKVEFKQDEIVVIPEKTDGKCKLKAFGQMSFKSKVL